MILQIEMKKRESGFFLYFHPNNDLMNLICRQPRPLGIIWINYMSSLLKFWGKSQPLKISQVPSCDLISRISLTSAISVQP